MKCQQLAIDMFERCDDVSVAACAGDRSCCPLGALSRLRQQEQSCFDLLDLWGDHGAGPYGSGRTVGA